MKNLKFIVILCIFMVTLGVQQVLMAVNTPQEAKHMAKLKRIIDEGYNKGKTAFVDEIVAQNYLAYFNGANDDVTGPDSIKENIKMNRERFQGFKVIIDDIFAKENKVTLCWTTEFMSPVSGKPAKFMGVYIGRFDKGKLVEGRQIYDTWTLNKEFGYTLTPPAAPDKK